MPSMLAGTLAPRETGSDRCFLRRGLSDRIGLTRHKTQRWLPVERLRKKVQKSREASEEAGTATRVAQWCLRADTALEMMKEVVLNTKYRRTEKPGRFILSGEARGAWRVSRVAANISISWHMLIIHCWAFVLYRCCVLTQTSLRILYTQCANTYTHAHKHAYAHTIYTNRRTCAFA